MNKEYLIKNKLMNYKFQFNLTVHEVNLAITFPCQLGLIWKSQSGRVDSIKNPSLKNGKAVFDETLTLC